VLCQAPILGRRESEPQRVDDLARETLLDGENVLQRAVELVGPELCVGPGVDELRGNPEVGTSAPDTSGQHIARAELARDGTQVLVAPLQAHRGLSRDDAQRLDHREVGNHLVGEAIGEMIGLLFPGHDRERQDRDRTELRVHH
jgi:hypothetical protein